MTDPYRLVCRFSDAGDDDRLCTLKRPAFEKRQGRNSRSVVRRRFGWLYGDLAAASWCQETASVPPADVAMARLWYDRAQRLDAAEAPRRAARGS
jgi:hypothetical protein